MCASVNHYCSDIKYDIVQILMFEGCFFDSSLLVLLLIVSCNKLFVSCTFYSLQCDTLSSRRNFIKIMLQQPPPLAVLDGACSRVSEAIAEVSSIWNIPHVCSPYKTKCVSIVECTLQMPSWIPLAHLGIVHSLPLWILHIWATRHISQPVHSLPLTTTLWSVHYCSTAVLQLDTSRYCLPAGLQPGTCQN